MSEHGIPDSELIVTIDGPAGSGKSTVGKMLAKKLGFQYLDTGALYRVATLAVMRAGIDLKAEPLDEKAVCAVVDSCKVTLTWDANKPQVVTLDGDDVTQAIRSEEVTNLIRYVADMRDARKLCSDLQREIARAGRFVCDGRDQGTEVFTDAFLKIYLWASPRVRAERRFQELEARGESVPLEDLERRIRMRDQLDMAREVGALRRAKDAVEIDSSELSIEETVEAIYAHCVTRMAVQ